MGLLDQLAGDFGQNNQQTQQPGVQPGIAAALMQALQQHPGGVGAVLGSLRENGLSGHVDRWSSGQQTPPTPAEVQQGLNGTGLIENTAQRAGVSHEVAAGAIAALLPALIRHFAPNGQAPAQSQLGGLAEQFLGRLL